MVKIAAIGWYGTETIGDRAIFAGLISLLGKTFQDMEISLGSLYPFYTERMLFEDRGIYSRMLGKGLKVSLFNSKKTKELDQAISSSDLVIMAGGPLMHIKPLHMVDYAFRKAKKLGKKTAVLGCGVGPIFHEEFHKALLSIFDNSDSIILRDKTSESTLRQVFSLHNRDLQHTTIHTALDPAIICAHEHRETETPVQNKEKFISINYRDFPLEYAQTSLERNINEEILYFTEHISRAFPDCLLRFTPMHYFHIGTDDRCFLNDLLLKLKLPNAVVQNKPLTLSETLSVFSDATFCIGMRFHSVLLQTVLNGKNIILDYTEPNKGKIYGFLKMIDFLSMFGKYRYINLQDAFLSFDCFDWENIETPFALRESSIETVYSTYREALSGLL